MSPSNIASSSRSSVVNEYKPLDKIQDSRLEQFTSTHQGKEIAVSKDTFEMMSKAHAILLKTAHKTIPDGPGNQKASIISSGGRSWMRLMVSRELGESSDTLDKFVKAIKRSGGGACGEHQIMAGLELKQVSRSQPAFLVTESNMDHAYMIIGDWRDKNVGDNAIVVDPWQGIKKIHTYGERINTDTPDVNNTISAGDPMPIPANVKKAMQAKVIAEEHMDTLLDRLIGIEIGPDAAQKVIKEMESTDSLWDSISSTDNLYTYYKDPDGNTSAFNDAPPEYIRSYFDARDVIELRAKDDDGCCTIM